MSDTAAAPSRLGFLLVDDFAMMSYASVAEAFRAANVLAGRTLYAWRHFSVSGVPARASNGVDLVVEGQLPAGEPLDILFVFAGGNPSRFDDRATFARLREAAARGVALAGVSGGPYLLARAGLLAGYRCTIHWEHEPGFVEAFPDVTAERGLYVIDRGRLTCAGGAAGMDLARRIIRDAHGDALADRIGEWFIEPRPRAGADAQRGTAAERYHTSHPALAAALEAMEDAIAEPLPREALAERAGVSLRQLERLFRAQLGRTIAQHYLGLRLDSARKLLRETDLGRIDVAVACGFADVSHFARVFRRRFGITPTEGRGTP